MSELDITGMLAGWRSNLSGSQGVRGSNPLSSTLSLGAVPAMFAQLTGYLARSISIS
jgi:hypothetical protein